MRIEVRRKAFGDKTVLKAVVLDLEQGSFTAITGPSGCGKTTLLRIAAGLDGDFEGSIDVPGRLGVVFQEPRLLPWRTVAENVELVREGDPLPLLSAVGLAEAAELYPRALSLGMARRAAMARALAVEPQVLLLDEPFVSLDQVTAKELRGLVRRLWLERRFTVLLVTHDLDEAREMAERIVTLAACPTPPAR